MKKSESSKKGRVQKVLYIAISVLIAVTLWMYIDSSDSSGSEKTMSNIPVEFIGEEDVLASRGLMIENGEDATITLKLKGSRSVISRLNKSNIKIQVDVSDITTTGTKTLDYDVVYPDSISKSSVTIPSASSYSVTVMIGKLYSAVVPVTVEITGSAADNYMVEEYTCSPDMITVYGTEADVAEVDHALINYQLESASSTIRSYMGYQLIDAAGNVIDNNDLRCSDDTVLVNIPVVTVKELPLAVDFAESAGSSLDDITYTISPETITVSGEANLLDTLISIDLPLIQLSQIMGDTTKTYDLTLPSGCTNLSGINQATVTIKFSGLVTKTLSTQNITFTNVPDGYTATAVTKSVDVTLRGNTTDIAAITAEDVHVVANLSSVVSAGGNYTITADIYVDNSETVGAIGSYQISYKLKKSS